MGGATPDGRIRRLAEARPRHDPSRPRVTGSEMQQARPQLVLGGVVRMGRAASFQVGRSRWDVPVTSPAATGRGEGSGLALRASSILHARARAR